MAYRDNTKSLTPSLKDGNSGTVKGSNPRPGRANKKPVAMSETGSVARPGYHQNAAKLPKGGTGSIARPGFHQKLPS